MTRRELLRGAGAVASLLPLRAQPASSGDWFDRPMRWAQLVFVEDDPGKFDAQFWLDYFKRAHADAVCLAGGGYMAFYPTKIPLHRRSRFLGNTDPFGEMVKGCRALGMNVIARTDPHAAHQEMYDKHPDWIHVEANGQKRRHWANPELWVTCALGPMNFEFMTAVNNEIVATYGVDGVFSNRWAGHGQCFCEHCIRNFREFSGKDLPRTADPRDPARRAYIVWQEKRLFDLWRLWDAEIRKVNPRARFIANSGGGALSNLDMKTVGQLSDILFADRQARSGLTPPWAAGKNGKEYRAAMGNKPIGGIFSVGVEEPYRWKDSVQHGPELQLWVADAIANGLRPWFAKFNAKPFDRRWFGPVEELYKWHFQNERYLRNEQNLARVAVVFSQQTAKFYGGERARAKVEDHTAGFYQALIESRIPFEMVHDRKLEPAQLAPFKLLILPNIACLSDAQCEQLRAYVRGGGSLIATHETSLYNEWGEPRADFGLADLFGAQYAGKVDARMQNSYLGLHGPHALLKGLEDAPRIINGVSRVQARGASGAPLTLIASYPDLPMEDVYPREGDSGLPGVHIKGRVMYFPWDIDRTFWEVLAVDHLKLLRNAIEWGLDADTPVRVTGPGVLDVVVWRQKSSVTVHLVNLTNPMMMKGPIRELFPVGAQRVSLRLPPGARPRAARLCVAGRAVRFTTKGSELELTVPSIGLHELVAIDLS